MPQDNVSDRALPWAAIVGLLLATGSAALYFSSLTSSRPPTPSDVKVRALGDQDAEARLWQDPLKAAWDRKLELAKNVADLPSDNPTRELAGAATPQAALVAGGSGGNPAGAPGIHEPRRPLARPSPAVNPTGPENGTRPKVLLLPVLVPGSRYGEDAERRLRARVAVLAGLAV